MTSNISGENGNISLYENIKQKKGETYKAGEFKAWKGLIILEKVFNKHKR